MPDEPFTLSEERRLLALSRYISALEQGEIEPLIEVLSEAEHDPVLAQLLQEVDALYKEAEQIEVSELEARRAWQTALDGCATSAVPQNGHARYESRQQSQLKEIRVKHKNKEIVMEEQTVMPMPLDKNSEQAAPPRRPRRRWLQILAAILIVGVLIAATPVLLNMRGQAGGSGSHAQLTPTTASTITATPGGAGDNYKTQAAHYVSQMNLADEIGQLLMVQYSSPNYSSDLDYMLHTLHVGGVIMYAMQLNSKSQASGDTARMQQRASTPLLISTDEEGGLVDRLSKIYGPQMSAMQIAGSGKVSVATQQGQKIAQELAALGINLNLAPDVDVNQINGQVDGYVMLDRTFGNTPDQVIKYAGAYLQAMQGSGTIACIKHFPGMGAADTHTTGPLVVNSSRQDIYNIDFAPFKALIQASSVQAQPGMIMDTDVLMPAIDPTYPAELSHAFITDILRNEFHYDGVVITDTLYVQGIAAKWNLNQAAILALQAGNDMLLGANSSQQASSMINAIKQAVQNGQLTKARIDQAATRIIALKMQYHLMPVA